MKERQGIRERKRRRNRYKKKQKKKKKLRYLFRWYERSTERHKQISKQTIKQTNLILNSIFKLFYFPQYFSDFKFYYFRHFASILMSLLKDYQFLFSLNKIFLTYHYNFILYGDMVCVVVQIEYPDSVTEVDETRWHTDGLRQGRSHPFRYIKILQTSMLKIQANYK